MREQRDAGHGPVRAGCRRTRRLRTSRPGSFSIFTQVGASNTTGGGAAQLSIPVATPSRRPRSIRGRRCSNERAARADAAASRPSPSRRRAIRPRTNPIGRKHVERSAISARRRRRPVDHLAPGELVEGTDAGLRHLAPARGSGRRTFGKVVYASGAVDRPPARPIPPRASCRTATCARARLRHVRARDRPSRADRPLSIHIAEVRRRAILEIRDVTRTARAQSPRRGRALEERRPDPQRPPRRPHPPRITRRRERIHTEAGRREGISGSDPENSSRLPAFLFNLVFAGG